MYLFILVACKRKVTCLLPVLSGCVWECVGGVCVVVVGGCLGEGWVGMLGECFRQGGMGSGNVFVASNTLDLK